MHYIKINMVINYVLSSIFHCCISVLFSLFKNTHRFLLSELHSSSAVKYSSAKEKINL